MNYISVDIPLKVVPELWRWFSSYLKKLPDKHPLKNFEGETILQAMQKGVHFVLQDRLTTGEGAGGWGKSDRQFMAYIYPGEKTPTDSVMTTVVVLLALRAHIEYLFHTKTGKAEKFSENVWQHIIDGLQGYLENRWDEFSGCGGPLAIGMHGDKSHGQSYRHTAWLLQLWYGQEGFKDKIDKTVECLINRYNYTHIKTKEKVATAVAAYKAFQTLQKHHYRLDSTDIARKLSELEDIISYKCQDGIQGWTSGKDFERGRQLYTLFTLAELVAFDVKDAELKKRMVRAMNATVSGRWRPKTRQQGLPWLSDGSNGPDFNSSCLAASVLMRKYSVTGTLPGQEHGFLEGLLIYLFSELASNYETTQSQIYAWTLSYLIKDICGLINNQEIS